ncbi:MAG: hypothetical protein ACD_11C00054G0020 [uncultured bacterium]|nr:MAG: hypothetical protein ACD_11C00054G0020 [uncultured bacterium]HBR72094.1 hypothetical protein [Candidatus Moranbacteria bacterium]
MLNIQNILNNAQFAINHIDDVLARKLLKEIEIILSDKSNVLDQEILKKLQSTRLKLRIVNFPNLSDEDAQDVMKNYYMYSYDLEVPMDNRITAKLFLIPEIPRDQLRKKLKEALLQNQQKLGNFSVRQWISEFEKIYNIKTRNLSAAASFSIEHPQAKMLSPIDREKLKELLYTYDYLLVTTLPATGPILDEMLEAAENFGRYGSSSDEQKTYTEKSHNNISEYVFESVDFQGKKTENIVKMSLNLALKNFPNLGEQLITSAPLKLKYFSEMAKPSVKNWIADYHSAIGVGKHTTMERGNFIFHSENAKSLSSTDRRKLAEVLKSLDDDMELEIDSAGQKIIFSVAQEREMDNISAKNNPVIERGDNSPNKNKIFEEPKKTLFYSQEKYEIPKSNIEKPIVSSIGWNPAQSVKKRMLEESGPVAIKAPTTVEEKSPQEIGRVRFSSPQQLPAEKESIATEKNEIKKSPDVIKKEEDKNISQNRPHISKPVYKISPMGFSSKSDSLDFGKQYKFQTGKSDDSISSGNIVDLRK